MERARELVAELRTLDLPPESRTEMSSLGIRLDRTFFQVRRRVPCAGVTRAGTLCMNTCDETIGRCGFHARAPTVPVEVESTPTPTCSDQTAKGEKCKRSVYKSLDVCWRHGLQKGLVEMPTPAECSICYDVIDAKNRKKTVCGHVFHKTCLMTWFERSADYKPPCPMCRRPLRRPATTGSAAPEEEEIPDSVFFSAWFLAQPLPMFDA